MLPKLLLLLLGGKSLKNLIARVVRSTEVKYMQSKDDTQRALLKKYVTMAKIVTNIELCSFGFAYICVHVVPFLISMVTNLWIDPLNLKIAGIR